MAQKLNPFSGRQFGDANGDPYVGAQLFIYKAGTTTKQTTTNDQDGASNHANPIILNGRGEPADAGGSAQAIWQPDGQAVKLVLAPAADSDPPTTPYATWDNIEGINDTEAAGQLDEWLTGTTPTYINATSFSVAGDQRSIYHVGRRVKTTNSGGTRYGTITAVAYTTLTAVTIRNDTGTLDGGLSAVSYALLTSENNAIPANINTFENIVTLPVTTGGSASAYTADVKENLYVTGRVYTVQIHTDNTGAATINLSGLGAKNIKTLRGYDPQAGALKNGMIAYFLYDGTNMVLLNQYHDGLFLGTNVDGAKAVTASENLTSGEYHYTSLSVSSGQTLGVSESSDGFLLLRVDGDVTIDGTISLDGKGSAGGAAPGASLPGNNGSDAYGGASGGGGGGSNSDIGGNGGASLFNNGMSLAGGAGGSATANGSIGTAVSQIIENGLIGTFGQIHKLNGAGGGSGAGGSTTDGGAGGDGGGTVIIIAKSITIGAAGVITCDGAAGSAAAGTNGGAGGGGGGGIVILIAYEITNNGAITVTGGAGGADPGTGGAGGDGGAGKFISYEHA